MSATYMGEYDDIVGSHRTHTERMPKYVRWVSVYTGPAVYANLKDEYLAALYRLDEVGPNVVIRNDEDILPEENYIRGVKLYNHLSVKVVVNKKRLHRYEICSIAAYTLVSCLTEWQPQLDYYRYWRDRLNGLGPAWEEEVRSRPEEFNHVIQFERGDHPLFEWEDKPVTALLRHRWRPEDVSEQFKSFPMLCGEDDKS